MQDRAEKPEDVDDAITAARLEKLRLEIESLNRSLKRKDGWANRFLPYLPITTALAAVAGLLIGIYQFNRQQVEQSIRDQRARQQEIVKPYLAKQIDSYLEVSKTASQIASTRDTREQQKLYTQLSEQIDGSLIVLADSNVVEAAIDFKRKYDDYLADPQIERELRLSVRELGAACRASLKSLVMSQPR